jgi:hypothetical protein
VRQFLAAPAFLFGIALLASSSAPQPRNLVAAHRRLRSALLSALAAANHARALSAPLAAAALALSASLGMAHAEEWWRQREDPFLLTPTYTEALRPPGAQSGKQLLGAPSSNSTAKPAAASISGSRWASGCSAPKNRQPNARP